MKVVFLPPMLALVLGVPTLYGLDTLGILGNQWVAEFVGIAVAVVYLLLGFVILARDYVKS